MTTPRVVGLDLSLTATGIAYDDNTTATIGSKAKGCERLADIRDHVLEAVHTYNHNDPVSLGIPVELVVIEDYAFSRAAAHSHQLGELGGVVRLALHEAGVPFVCVVPSSLKKYATGKGNANKGEMLAAAIRRLDYEGASDNEADALWLRAMGLDALGTPLVAMSAVNRSALEKVVWPS